jgi:NAD(P)-dependent dehydrogenase (short-subunit alcohol dehydrogenase family)
MARWDFDSIPDQTGRKAIVTGANAGIGYETALALATKGAHVILACRNEVKGQEALNRLQADGPSGSAEMEQLDLADLDNVKAFAQRIHDKHDRLDLLILNAGVMIPPESQTAQGFELQFGVNHLGHFALTGALMPLVTGTEESRVVVVSSTAARRGELAFDDLNFTRRGYKAWGAYCQSKLANQLFTRELQKRLKGAGTRVLVTAAHPGWTATDLQRSSGFMQFLNKIFAQAPALGALPTLRAAVDPDVQEASYYGPDGFMQMRGYPRKIDMVKLAMVDSDAGRLWEVSEELTEVRYEF